MPTTSNGESTQRSNSPKKLIFGTIRSGIKVIGKVLPQVAGRLVFSLMIRPQQRQIDLSRRNSNLEGFKFRVGERRLQAYEWNGDRRALFVHGWGASSADFSGLIRKISQAGWGGLVYDAPAHGRSEGSTTDFLELGAAFRRVRQAHGPFDAVIGHSLGSAVVLYQLAQSGDQAPNFIISGGAPASLKQVFTYYADQLDLTPEVWEDLQRRIKRRLGQPASAFSITDSIQELDADLLLVHDHEDKYFPIDTAHRLRAAASEVRLIETNGLGHRGWLKNGQVLSDVVSFLSPNRRAETEKLNAQLVIGS